MPAAQDLKQYLQEKDARGGSVYDHLTGLIAQLITDKPASAQQLFEHLSAAAQTKDQNAVPKRVLMVRTSNGQLGESGEQTG